MKRLVALLLLVITVPSILFAIGFGYHVLDLRTSPEFGKGVFPTSLCYQFNFPMPGDATLLTFRLDNGLDFRTLYQDPVSGKILKMYSDEFAETIPVRDYSTLFDEFNLLFEQGLFHSDFSKDSILKVGAAIGGRFELSFENLSWMSDESHTMGLLYSSPGIPRFTSFDGTPGLAKYYVDKETNTAKLDRSSTHTFLTFTLGVNFMQDEYAVKNGVKFTSLFKLSQSWMPLNDGTADFFLSDNKLSLAITPVVVKQKNNNLSWFSIVYGNNTEYRYILGKKVPYYVQGGDIYSIRSANTEHIITNRTYMTINGPQIVVKDLYPSIMFFHDLALSFGKVLNMSDPDSIMEYAGVVGLKASFEMYNICSFFYEIGYTYVEQFTYERHKVDARFGFTLEI